MYDVNKTGTLVSLIKGRFAMEINYRYELESEEKVIDEESGEEKEVIFVEELVSAVLTDENTKVDGRNEELVIGLSVLAGAMVTIALIAIIYGQRKKSTRRRWQKVQQREAERSEETYDDVEIVIVPMTDASLTKEEQGNENYDDFEIGPIPSPSLEEEDGII